LQCSAFAIPNRFFRFLSGSLGIFQLLSLLIGTSKLKRFLLHGDY